MDEFFREIRRTDTRIVKNFNDEKDKEETEDTEIKSNNRVFLRKN